MLPKTPALLAFALLLSACSAPGGSKKEKNKPDTIQHTRVAPSQPGPQRPEIRYTALALKNNDTAISYFRKHFSQVEQELIYTLNRIDAKELWRPDTLIIPDTFLKDRLAYSPFPSRLLVLDSVNKIVIFSYPVQAFAVYENGRLIKWGATSMGSKIHKTPTGLHFTNWKSKKAVSTVKEEWILPWNFNIMNKAGVGWHEYNMPGFPASHSCLRLHETDAKWLYYWADQWILDKNDQLLAKGTPVLVYGDYPWGARRPWRNMLENPQATVISADKLQQELAPFLSEIRVAQQQREAIQAKQDTVKAAAAAKAS